MWLKEEGEKWKSKEVGWSGICMYVCVFMCDAVTEFSSSTLSKRIWFFFFVDVASTVLLPSSECTMCTSNMSTSNEICSMFGLFVYGHTIDPVVMHTKDTNEAAVIHRRKKRGGNGKGVGGESVRIPTISKCNKRQEKQIKLGCEWMEYKKRKEEQEKKSKMHRTSEEISSYWS